MAGTSVAALTTTARRASCGLLLRMACCLVAAGGGGRRRGGVRRRSGRAWAAPSKRQGLRSDAAGIAEHAKAITGDQEGAGNLCAAQGRGPPARGFWAIDHASKLLCSAIAPALAAHDTRNAIPHDTTASTDRPRCDRAAGARETALLSKNSLWWAAGKEGGRDRGSSPANGSWRGSCVAGGVWEASVLRQGVISAAVARLARASCCCWFLELGLQKAGVV